MKNPKKVSDGKKSRAQGAQFELRVRADLESKGWIVDKWTNNLKCILYDNEEGNFSGKIIIVPAKPHMVFNPVIKRMIPLQRSSGFPDFIAFKYKGTHVDHRLMIDIRPSQFYHLAVEDEDNWTDKEEEEWEKLRDKEQKEIDQKREASKYEKYEIIGIEVKMTDELDRKEKEKCIWLLKNNIFSKILIAKKTKVKNKIVIVYEDFKEIEKRMRK